MSEMEDLNKNIADGADDFDIKTESHSNYLTKILNIERNVLENIVQGKDLKPTLNHFLSEIENLYPSIYLTIMLADTKIKNLELYAGLSLQPSFSKHLQKIPIKEQGGACGTAAFRKEAIIVPDVTKSALMRKYWDLLKEFGFKACWSYPILSSKGAILGTFALNKKSKGLPSKELEEILKRASNIISLLIENRQSELANKQLTERYRLAMDASNEAIWDWDIKNNSLMWGAGFEKNFGYPLEKSSVNMEWWSVNIHPDEKESVIKSLTTAIESKVFYWSYEYRYRAADGDYRFVLDRGNIIRSKNHKATRMVGAMMDLTERKKTEKELLNNASELARSNAELEEFAYMASHDLQEPLRMVISFLQLLKKKYSGGMDETASQYIDIAVDGAERMKILIKDLLRFSKISFQIKEVETVNLNDLLQELKNVFSDRLLQEDGVLKIGDLPNVKGQKALFAQVFQNLIGNALKYRGKETPEIKISSKENDDNWEFIVSDNGIGIEEKFYEKIFIVFQRLHSRSEFQGTGIGLAICKKIIEKYGGNIWVESTRGFGSEFHFTIPKIIG